MTGSSRTSQAAPRATSSRSAPGDAGEKGTESYVRRAGRQLIIAFYGALRAIKL